LPTGMTRETVIDNICLTCGELELLFTNPTFLAAAVKSWSDSKIYKWSKLWETEQKTYDPLTDYNITETVHDTGSGSGSGTSTDQVSAYNETDFQNANKNINNSSSSSQADRTRTVSGHSSGKTYQELIKQEREAANFSTYDIIAEDFKNTFCVLTY